MYDNQHKDYPFGTFDFGSGGEVFSVKGPKGKKGLLMNYGYRSPTETFNAVTTPATISIGKSGDADYFGDEFPAGSLADQAGELSIRTAYREIDTGFDTYMLIREIPADTEVLVTCVAPTGGTPAGMAIPFVEIVWEK